MKAVLLALVVLVGGGAAITSCQAQPPFAKFEKFTGRLETADGRICSGTRYGTAVLTSRHCLEGPGNQIRFQGILVNIKRVYIRGENIYVWTDRDWGAPPRLAKPPRKGEPLYIIGNAAGFNQIARVVTLAGIANDEPKVPGALIIACGNCWHGDSGAGVFNARGELVAVWLGEYNFYMIEGEGTSRQTLSTFNLHIAAPL